MRESMVRNGDSAMRDYQGGLSLNASTREGEQYMRARCRSLRLLHSRIEQDTVFA